MTKQCKHRITNWKEYNKSLVERGGINLWISRELLDKWISDNKVEKKGRPLHYSDQAILMCLSLKYLYKVPYRASEGLVNSLFKLLEVPLKSPSYTQLHRRSKQIKVPLRRINIGKGIIDIVVDTTGLKIHGEGEWKVRKYGFSKYRDWKKLHIAVDPLDMEIVAYDLTSNSRSDDQHYPDLLDNIEDEIERCFADGAYDKKACYKSSYKKGIRLITPPHRLAAEQKPGKIDTELITRDNYIKRLKSLTNIHKDKEVARKLWKIEQDYHTRSLAESAMSRFKKICGSMLDSNLFETQKTEVAIKINILNQFAQLGMPISNPIYS